MKTCGEKELKKCGKNKIIKRESTIQGRKREIIFEALLSFFFFENTEYFFNRKKYWIIHLLKPLKTNIEWEVI